MPQQGTTPITAPIAPNDPADKYPGMDDEYLKGGYRVVVDKSTRNSSIPEERRKLGMLVRTNDDHVVWSLINNPNSDTTQDSDWEEFSSGGGGGGDIGLTITGNKTVYPPSGVTNLSFVFSESVDWRMSVLNSCDWVTLGVGELMVVNGTSTNDTIVVNYDSNYGTSEHGTDGSRVCSILVEDTNSNTKSTFMLTQYGTIVNSLVITDSSNVVEYDILNQVFNMRFNYTTNWTATITSGSWCSFSNGSSVLILNGTDINKNLTLYFGENIGESSRICVVNIVDNDDIDINGQYTLRQNIGSVQNYLTVTPQNRLVETPAGVTDFLLEFTQSTSWVVSYDTGAIDWFAIKSTINGSNQSSINGTGISKRIYVDYQDYYGNGTSGTHPNRVGVVSVRSLDNVLQKEFTIEQKCSNNNNSISITPINRLVDYDVDTSDFNVRFGYMTEWDAVIDNNWVSFSSSSTQLTINGVDISKDIDLFYDANNSGSVRSAIITVKDSNDNQYIGTHTISQNPIVDYSIDLNGGVTCPIVIPMILNGNGVINFDITPNNATQWRVYLKKNGLPGSYDWVDLTNGVDAFNLTGTTSVNNDILYDFIGYSIIGTENHSIGRLIPYTLEFYVDDIDVGVDDPIFTCSVEPTELPLIVFDTNNLLVEPIVQPSINIDIKCIFDRRTLIGNSIDWTITEYIDTLNEYPNYDTIIKTITPSGGTFTYNGITGLTEEITLEFVDLTSLSGKTQHLVLGNNFGYDVDNFIIDVNEPVGVPKFVNSGNVIVDSNDITVLNSVDYDGSWEIELPSSNTVNSVTPSNGTGDETDIVFEISVNNSLYIKTRGPIKAEHWV